MPVGAFVPSRIHLDYPEWQAPVVGDTGKVWAYTGSGYAPVSLAFDPAGTAAAAVAAHVEASNPHSQYYLASGVSAYGATLIDDANAATARTTLGLGTAATLNVGTSANNVVQLDGSAKLPAVDGSQLTGITATAAPGGSSTQVQYNASGSLAGDAGMTYDASTDRLTVAGGIVAGDFSPPSDSTTAWRVWNAARSTRVVTVDTTNSKMSVSGSSALAWGYNTGGGLVTIGNANAVGSLFCQTPSLNSSWPCGLGIDGSWAANRATINIKAFGVYAGSQESNLVFYTTSATSLVECLRLRADGRVGMNGSTIPRSALDVAGTTGINWGAGSSSTGLVTIGDSGVGASFFVHTPSLSSSYSSGLGIDGTYSANVSTINIKAFSVNHPLYASNLSMQTVVSGVLTEVLRLSNLGYAGVGTTTPTALLDLAASTTSRASLRIRAGTAPTSPNAGDIYFDGTNFFGYNGSAWKQLDN
jgi:hypothetical protein